MSASQGPYCALCGRQERLTRHHLIPRARHGKRRVRRRVDRETLKQAVILVCRPCHDQIHRVLDEHTLEQDYNTAEALLAHPEIRRFAEWIARRPAGFRPKRPHRG